MFNIFANKEKKEDVENKSKAIAVEKDKKEIGIYYAHISSNFISPYSDDPIDRIKLAAEKFEKALEGKL